MTLDAAMRTIQTLLDGEQQRGALRGAEDLATRKAYRETIREQIEYLEQQLALVKEEVQNLPKFPPQEIIQWAQAVCEMPNLAFLEVDTTGLHEDAEIIRLCALPASGGSPLIDILVKPSHPLSSLISTITGISNDHVQQEGIDSISALTRLQGTLRGKYVLSYNLEFDIKKLQEAAQRGGVQPITMIGDDLMARAMRYFSLRSYPKLEDLCKRIEHPLPERPQQTILDRARGQRHLLNAMAQIITGPANAPATPTADKETSDDEDEHPF